MGNNNKNFKKILKKAWSLESPHVSLVATVAEVRGKGLHCRDHVY